MRWYRAAHMWAFDLIELDGADMRREPLAQPKASLERGQEGPSLAEDIALFDHLMGDP